MKETLQYSGQMVHIPFTRVLSEMSQVQACFNFPRGPTVSLSASSKRHRIVAMLKARCQQSLVCPSFSKCFLNVLSQDVVTTNMFPVLEVYMWGSWNLWSETVSGLQTNIINYYIDMKHLHVTLHNYFISQNRQVIEIKLQWPLVTPGQ